MEPLAVAWAIAGQPTARPISSANTAPKRRQINKLMSLPVLGTGYNAGAVRNNRGNRGPQTSPLATVKAQPTRGETRAPRMRSTMRRY